MYLQTECGEFSFKIDEGKIKAKRIYNRKIYRLEKEMTTNSIDYLWKVLKNLKNLPIEFWKES